MLEEFVEKTALAGSQDCLNLCNQVTPERTLRSFFVGERGQVMTCMGPMTIFVVELENLFSLLVGELELLFQDPERGKAERTLAKMVSPDPCLGGARR
jgi:hypothetical protein